MLKKEKEYREWERTTVGNDPCEEFIQLVILSPDNGESFLLRINF